MQLVGGDGVRGRGRGGDLEENEGREDHEEPLPEGGGDFAVVELADSEQLAVLPRELIRLRFPLSDGGDNPPWLLRLAAESVGALIRVGVPVLVCCSAGMSRSVCIAAGAVALAEGLPLDEALNAVVGLGPADVSPGLLVQLRQALGG